MTNEQLWQAVLGELELTISKANFNTWFKNTFISSYENENVIIGVPNGFTKSWLENKYHDKILKSLQRITNNKAKTISYKIEIKKCLSREKLLKNSIKAIATEKILTKEEILNGYGLNPRYAFESFVVGKGNELAHAACKAVADNPGKIYNPLFIYGGTGLGKTHLMQAIGHAVLKKYHEKKVIYVTSERFTDEFIRSIRRGQTEEFKKKYRSTDILLVDDIQFLAGKESTQEEFFHTFNALHQENKQIVISSDRPPKAIPALENRLVSRFEWGMIADIIQPDFETRVAILEEKCKEKNFFLSDEMLKYIANTIQSNVRELEGALNRIIAFYQLNKATPTIDSIKNTLSGLTSFRKRDGALTPKQIINTVADFFDIDYGDLVGSSRKKNLVTPRQITMYLLREDVRSSFPSIGQELGGRDHTTAMHAYGKIKEFIEKDEKIRQDINLLRQRLYNK